MKLLTLAIPTNGILEWVIPVLDSIYNQGVDDGLFEVVITDNGIDNKLSSKIKTILNDHKNLIYKKTNAYLFMNQIEAFNLATGKFIKFVNHRTLLKDGALKYLINFVKENEDEKPITYFLNNAYVPKEKDYYYSNFDKFVYELSYFASWSGGVGCWKSDMKTITENFTYFRVSKLFPHLLFVYNNDSQRNYCIKREELFHELTFDPRRKGKYDIFYAFGVEYINIVNDLLNKKLIDRNTYLHILNENKNFIVYLYSVHCIMKKPCSYDLSSRKESLNLFYSYNEIRNKAIKRTMIRGLKRIRNILIEKRR